MKHTQEKWYERNYTGTTSKSNPLEPVYYRNVCDKRQPNGRIIATVMGKDKDRMERTPN